jgi:O-antigen ligase
MIATIRYKGSKWLYFVLPLLAVSVVLTFHRLDLIILAICAGSYIYFFGNSTQRIFATLGILVASTIVIVSLILAQGKSELVEERLKADTWTLRMNQYAAIAGNLPAKPLGFGDYENPAFARFSGKHGLLDSYTDRYGNWYNRPYYVHNGYFEVAAMYGVPAMVAFVALLVSLFRYFKRLARSDFMFLIPVYATLIWMLANLTNGITAFRIYYIVLYGLLAGSFVAIRSSTLTTTPKGATDSRQRDSRPLSRIGANPSPGPA